MEWKTEKPTEPGFYFATDGSPVLCVYILNREGELYDVASTYQSSWAGPGAKSYESYHMTPKCEPMYWCEIPVPDKPRSPQDEVWENLEDDEAEDALLVESGALLKFIEDALQQEPSDDWEAELDNL